MTTNGHNGHSGHKRKERERHNGSGRQGFLAALDVGTHKIACFIAQAEAAKPGEEAGLRVVGIGHQLSRGVRAGAIVDMDRAEAAIRAAVEAAERMADVTVRDVVISVTCGQPHSQALRVETELNGREASDEDARRLVALARMEARVPGRVIVQTNPLNYVVDATNRVRDPRGLVGERLGATVHTASVLEGPLANLELCVERCHLSVAGRLLAPYASGLSALVGDEMDLGATVLDMGAGTTSIAVFFEGALVFADVVPLGGASITNDIARALGCTVQYAERIKTLYGSALASVADDKEVIAVPQVGEEDSDTPNQVPKSLLTGIIRPRLDEIFEMARDRLEASGAEGAAGRRVVLTGGASQLTGAREVAHRILNRPTRTGRPLRLMGLAEATQGPAFAACAGLLGYPQLPSSESEDDSRFGDPRFVREPWRRITQWIKENF